MIASITIYLVSCKKIDHSLETNEGKLEKFFSYQQKDPIIKNIIKSLKNKNNQSGFALNMISKSGYPAWDKSVVAHNQVARRGLSEEDTIYTYTPFYSDWYQNIQSVFITRIIGEDTTYKCVFGNDYHVYPTVSDRGSATKTDVALLFFYFENVIFNKEGMKIKDYKHLFEHSYSNGLIVYPSEVTMSRQMCQSTSTSYIRICNVVIEDDDFDQYQYDTGILPEHGSSGSHSYVVCKSYFITSTEYYDCGSGGYDPGWGSGSGGTTNPPPAGLTIPNDPYPYENDPDRTIKHGPSAPATTFDGWEPLIPHTPGDEPIDSLLKKTSTAANTIADSLLTLSLNNPKKEYCATIVRKNEIEYPKNIKTDYDSNSVTPNLALAPGEELLATIHTHPKYPELDRSAGSHGDIAGLTLRKNFISYIECGNVRYALVCEDVTKAIAFFKTQNPQKLRDSISTIAQQQPNWFSNWQGATQAAIEHVLGSAATNGIGFYISNNATKTEYTKLNP